MMLCFHSFFFFVQNLAKYDWPLTLKVSSNQLEERLTSRQGVVTTNAETALGVLTRTNKGTVNLGSYTGECLGNLDICNAGLSLSFWMNYNGKETGTSIGYI